MKNSILEITESEYCFKLSKDTFDIAYIRQLYKRIKAEQFFFNKHPHPLEEDIISKSTGDRFNNFDQLADK